MAGVLIERAGFLVSLEGLLGEALDGSGRLVFLGGEAGVGKTTLAAALADAAILVEFVANDAMETEQGLKRPEISYLNLRGSQDPRAPLRFRVANHQVVISKSYTLSIASSWRGKTLRRLCDP